MARVRLQKVKIVAIVQSTHAHAYEAENTWELNSAYAHTSFGPASWPCMSERLWLLEVDCARTLQSALFEFNAYSINLPPIPCHVLPIHACPMCNIHKLKFHCLSSL